MKPDYVYDIDDCQYDDTFQIGIVININSAHTCLHCGIAYNLTKEKDVLHQYTKLSHDKGIDKFMCIIKPSFNITQQKAMTPFLTYMAKKVDEDNLKIPYGFRYENYSKYDEKEGFILNGDTSGLTCATFILTIFHTFGIDLIDLEHWPIRDDDKKWEKHTKQICNIYKERNDMSREQILQMESEIGSKRYRPEEVAVSSALYDGNAADSNTIIRDGQELYNYLLTKSS